MPSNKILKIPLCLAAVVTRRSNFCTRWFTGLFLCLNFASILWWVGYSLIFSSCLYCRIYPELEQHAARQGAPHVPPPTHHTQHQVRYFRICVNTFLSAHHWRVDAYVDADAQLPWWFIMRRVDQNKSLCIAESEAAGSNPASLTTKLPKKIPCLPLALNNHKVLYRKL